MAWIWRDEAQSSSGWWMVGLAALAALLLILPNQAVVTKYVNDVLIFLDGAYRVNLGQVPNRDFHTALGPLTYYLPAFAATITGTLGTAMPMGMALLIIALAPALAHILSSRLRPVLGIPFAAFLILILAVPMNLGDGIMDLSFGMFYNRIGWAALATLLVMHLQPTAVRRHQALLDTAAAAFLTLTMIYTKASYGAVAVAFLVLMLLDPRQRRWAAAALGVVVLTSLIVEAVWRGTAAHAADLIAAARVSGKRPFRELAEFVLRNFADYVLFGLVAGLSLWRTRSLRDALFYALCSGAGLLLISQNFQTWGIITLYAGAVVAAERLARAMRPEDEGRRFSLPGAAPLLMLAFLLPTIAHCTLALGLHTALASARAGEPFGISNYEGLRLASVWQPGDYSANAHYLATLREGVAFLQRMEPKPRGVFVLDFVSPFSSAAAITPLRGDTAWQHWGRNVSEAVFVPPEDLFRDAEIVMEPKIAIEGVTGDNLRLIYGEYVKAHYELVHESQDWKVYRRTPAPQSAEATPRR
jgi:hypothetical protein